MNLRDNSRREWSPNSASPTTSELQVGALQRIADATEKIAADHDRLIQERDFWRNSATSCRKYRDRAERSRAATRGHLTRITRQRDDAVEFADSLVDDFVAVRDYLRRALETAKANDPGQDWIVGAESVLAAIDERQADQ